MLFDDTMLFIQPLFEKSRVGRTIFIKTRVCCQRFRIPDYDEPFLCAGERDVQPPWVRQEPEIAFLVRAHAREDDEPFLRALEAVGRCYGERTAAAESSCECLVDECHLRPVWREDSDVVD